MSRCRFDVSASWTAPMPLAPAPVSKPTSPINHPTDTRVAASSNHVGAFRESQLGTAAPAGPDAGDSGTSAEETKLGSFSGGLRTDVCLSFQTENLFHTYSQFSAAPNIPPKPSDEERDTETKLEELLEKVRLPTQPPPTPLTSPFKALLTTQRADSASPSSRSSPACSSRRRP